MYANTVTAIKTTNFMSLCFSFQGRAQLSLSCKTAYKNSYPYFYIR